MTTSHMATLANSGGAIPHRTSARLVSSGAFALWTHNQVGMQLQKLMLLAVACLFGSFRLFAATATLAWDANPEADIAGYKLSYGESPGNYTTTVDAGNRTVADVAELTQGKTYYFSVAAYNTSGKTGLPSTEVSYTVGASSFITGISPDRLSVHYVDSEDPDGYLASYAIDGDPDSFWHTVWRTVGSPPPHELQVDLGSASSLSGFRYLPRQDTYKVGNIGQYEFYISTNGIDWGEPVATGSFSNTKEAKNVTFAAKNGRYVRLRALTDATGASYSNVAELTLLHAVDIPIEGINTAPIPNAQSQYTNKDTPLNISLTGTDTEHSVLSYSVAPSPASGTLPETAPNLTYTPSTDYNGVDSFSFVVSDGISNSRVETISISVTPENDSPDGKSLILATDEDKPLPVILSGSDRDLDNLTFFIASEPSDGTLVGTAPNLTYIPSPNFNGSDQFTFRVNDGTTNSQTVTAFITVTPVNDAPVILGKSLTTAEDEALSVILEGSDSDGSPLSYSVVSSPVNGSLSGTAPNLSYSPAANYSGSDSFTYRVNDEELDSEIATISIEVTPVNDAPVANSVVMETTIDSPLLFVLGGRDIEGDQLAYSIVTPPINGTLTGIAPNLTYTPNRNYSGSDHITFKTTDDSLESAVATVSVSVTPREKETTIKPGIFVVKSITLQASENEPIALEKLETVPEVGTALSFKKVSGPGWLRVSEGGILSGTPEQSDVGTNSFIVSVSDSLDRFDEATLTISVAPSTLPATSINQAPAFVSNPIAMKDANANAPYTDLSLAGQAVDSDANDSLRYWKVSGPAWLNIAPNGELSGTPPTASTGMNQFAIGVADASSAVAYSELKINVIGLPLPWSTTDLGTGQIAGSNSYRAGTFTQAGSGILGNQSDKLRFTYQTLSGDGEIVAKVALLETTGPSSCAGVMIRDSLAPDSTEAFIGISDDKSYRQASRIKYGKSTSIKWVAPTGTPASWVRLVRNATEQQIYAYTSSDGVNWAHVGTTTTRMKTNCVVGLVVASGNDSTLTTSIFSNVWVAP